MCYKILSLTTCLLHTFQDKLRNTWILVFSLYRGGCGGFKQVTGLHGITEYAASINFSGLRFHGCSPDPCQTLGSHDQSPWPCMTMTSKFPGPHVCSPCSWKTPVLPPSIPPDPHQMFLLPEDFPETPGCPECTPSLHSPRYRPACAKQQAPSQVRPSGCLRRFI